MTRHDLENKANRLYDIVREIDDLNTGDEDVEWCLHGLRDYTKTLLQIAEELPVPHYKVVRNPQTLEGLFGCPVRI